MFIFVVMETGFERYKGIHPGAIIERELKQRQIAQRPFALSLGEHPQTFNAIIKGRRGLNTPLSMKIEKALELNEGTLMILQVYFDIKQEKLKERKQPNLKLLRKSLFWDTDFESIDWDARAKAVIKRIFERGNEEEKNEIVRFYGNGRVKAVMG